MNHDAGAPRIWLERLSEKHFEDFHRIWSSKETMLWSPRVPMENIEQSRKFMQKSLIAVCPEIDKFGIMLNPELCGAGSIGQSKMIGLIGTKGKVEGYGEELAYMVHCDYWNRGYMTEAVMAFAGPQGLFWDLDNRKDINRLVAMIDEENVASTKTIAKVGGKRGERIVKEYGLARDQGPDGQVPEEKLRDVICWYVDRPEK